MKRWQWALCIGAAAVAGLVAQTRIDVRSAGHDPPASWRLMVALPDGSLVPARLEGSTIEGSGADRVVRIVLAPQTREVFRPPVNTSTFTLSAPAVDVAVYRNGLLMARPDDYSIVGDVLTFVPRQVCGAGDIVQVEYRGRGLGVGPTGRQR